MYEFEDKFDNWIRKLYRFGARFGVKFQVWRLNPAKMVTDGDAVVLIAATYRDLHPGEELQAIPDYVLEAVKRASVRASGHSNDGKWEDIPNPKFTCPIHLYRIK